MTPSLLAAKIIAPYLILIGLSCIMNAKFFINMVEELKKSPFSLMIGGFISLFLGLLLVNTHNIWELDYRLITTIIGWIALLKGVSIILFPKAFVHITSKVKMGKSYYLTVGPIALIIGLYLAYMVCVMCEA